MARGQGKQSGGGSAKSGQWTQFVDISLAGVTEKDIELAFGDGDTLADALSGLLSSGYRLGISYDSGRDCFIASLTCKADGSPNEGCTVTSFAASWYQALMVTCYKHFKVAGEVWPKARNQAGGPSFG